LYDKHAGGLGVCDELFNKCGQLLQKARDLLASCPCGSCSVDSIGDSRGCPSCLLDQR
jgi:ATP-dependent helicase YprA (DUF1998 family)